MLKTRVIPCLLLQSGGLVKTVKFKNPTYIGDPINAVKIFNEKFVDELILLDIAASKNNKRPDFTLLQQVAEECFIPFCYGGGITTLADAEQIFKLGAEKIALNSAIIDKPDFVQELAKQFGSQSIVVSIDVKKNCFGNYELMKTSINRKVNCSLLEYVKRIEGYGAGEIMVNAIDCDGMMMGYDTRLLNEITSIVAIPVIACGGAGSLQDMRDVVLQSAVSAVAVGSFFIFKGKHKAVLINYPSYSELLKLFTREN